ncbi:MAG: 4-hydroxy-3-methylbut-2-enyl diphosphate reductase [Sedimentisphaerales bacterium]|nr:4-hydroxy-3-methylbut-2-enyl diphosphate reductase [Sedimentisphaerales bacterium]
MKVMVAEKYGFCAGVRNAISTAEKVLAERGRVYSLGPIIHNSDVVERLAKKGLITVDNVEQIPQGATALIRSHGAASEEIARLKEKNADIVDATCVLVKRVQQIAAQMEQEGYRVVIVGDREHPEVRAVVGCTRNAVVVGDASDTGKIGDNGRLGVVCQTTQSPEFFGRLLAAIAIGGFNEMRVINTLCKEAIKRQQAAVDLCRKVNTMFVLGGLESANTKKLAELCKKYNNRTFHLQNWDEFDKKVVLGCETAGVTAGASTPQWIIDDFVKKLAEV